MRFAVFALMAVIAGGCASGGSTPKPPTTQADAITPTPKIFVESYGLTDRMYAVIGGDTPLKSAKMMEDANSPDHRRQGIFSLVKYDFGQKDPYTRRYRQIAQTDSDFTVRAAAIRGTELVARSPRGAGFYYRAHR